MYKLRKLSNGIPVFIEKMNHVKSAAIGVFVGTGAKYELAGEEGISHLLEHMMFKGTKKRSAREISEEIDRVGGHINAYTSKENTAYYVTLLGEHVGTAIEILSDIYINSQFCEEELEKEKKVVIEEINMYEDVPEDKIHEMNIKNVLKGSGVANSILGSKESVNIISREQLKSYWEESYTTDNMVISVAGNIDEDEIVEKLEEKFGAISRKLEKREYNKNFILNAGENLIESDINQVHICLATEGISYMEENKYIMSVIANILGGNMSSRLFQKIREDRGLAYSVYAYNSHYREGGIFTIYAGTTSENYLEVRDLIEKELELIKKDGVEEDELQKVKNQLISDITLGLETTRAIMSRMANSYLNYGEIKDIDGIIEKIKNISREDIQKMAGKIFQKSKYSFTALGKL